MTIDRAIEILDPTPWECCGGLDEVNEACRMGVEAMKRQKWIPCSERGPDVNQPVLFWASRLGTCCAGHYDHTSLSGAVWFTASGTDTDYVASYWMPMPEPPEEKTANEEIWHRQPPTAACHVLAFVRFNGYADDFPDQLATLRYTPKDGWLKNGQPIDPEIATVTCWVPMPEAGKDD